MPLPDNRTHGTESEIDVVLLHDNQTPSMVSVMPQSIDNYEDPWPLPTRSQPNFQWGSKDGKAFCDNIMIDEAYNDIIHWKRNIFLLPSGATGKAFIREITRLLQTFAEGSAMECIALKASFVMQILLLQKPSQKSKSRDHVTHQKRRLDLWKQGNIPSLVEEGRCIQRYLLSRPRPSDDDAIAHLLKVLLRAIPSQWPCMLSL